MANEAFQDRLPPQSIEAEQAVLGSIFLDADTLVGALEFIEAKDFYRRGHQLIFQAMMNLNDENEAIDIVTVTNALESKNQLEDVGGIPYLADLAVAVPTAANMEYYAKIVEQKSILRNLIHTATEIVAKGYEESDEVASILDDAERSILEVSERRSRTGFLSISDVLNSTVAQIDQLYQNDEEINKLTHGL